MVTDWVLSSARLPHNELACELICNECIRRLPHVVQEILEARPSR